MDTQLVIDWLLWAVGLAFALWIVGR
jgi:hypothetical protein